MKKSERLALYEWCEKNKNKSGVEKVFSCTATDYVAIRTRIHNGYPYAGYEIVENNRDTKKVRIYIK